MRTGLCWRQTNASLSKGQVVISEIDVEHLRTERRVNTTFAACHANCVSGLPVRISTEYVNSRDLNLTRTFEPHPFVPQGAALDERCEEVFSIQVSGLAQRLVHTKAKSAVIGISGGLDSTLALLVCVKTFDKLGWSRQASSALLCRASGRPTVLTRMPST